MTLCSSIIQQIGDGPSQAEAIRKAGDVLSSCLQWDATVRAGVAQAKAARHAGNMALLAGLLAVLAAAIVAGTGYWGVRKQFDADLVKQRREREFAVKRDVYLSTANGLFAGLMVIGRFADLRIPVEACLSEFADKAPDIARMHMVARLETAEAIVTAVMGVSQAHVALVNDRVELGIPTDQLSVQGEWQERCFKALSDQIPLFSKAISLMREELELSIDVDAYQKMVERLTEETLERSRISLGLLIKHISDSKRG